MIKKDNLLNEDEDCDDGNTKNEEDDDDEEIKYKGVYNPTFNHENGITLDKENLLSKTTKHPYNRKKRHTESDDDI